MVNPMADPATTSRRTFTETLLAVGPPPDATPAFEKIWNDTNKLVERLAHHDVMEPNIDRMWNEPARRRSKVYFMWDFAFRTRSMMGGVNPSNPSRSRGDAYQDVVSRSMMTSMLIDDQDRQIDMMCNEPGDKETEFGQEIVGLAKEIGRDCEQL